jgi:hypothetical protein
LVYTITVPKDWSAGGPHAVKDIFLANSSNDSGRAQALRCFTKDNTGRIAPLRYKSFAATEYPLVRAASNPVKNFVV